MVLPSLLVISTKWFVSLAKPMLTQQLLEALARQVMEEDPLLVWPKDDWLACTRSFLALSKDKQSAIMDLYHPALESDFLDDMKATHRQYLSSWVPWFRSLNFQCLAMRPACAR